MQQETWASIVRQLELSLHTLPVCAGLPANGSAARLTMQLEVHEMGVLGLVQRSGLSSPQLKQVVALIVGGPGGAPSDSVAQTTKFALPSPSVSKSAQPSPVLPPDHC